MFLESMSWKEIRKRAEQNEDFLDRNSSRILGEWEKIIKKRRPLPLCFYKVVKNNQKDEFLFVANSRDGKHLLSAVFACIETTKGKAYVQIDLDDYSDTYRDMISPHFLKRYRERRLEQDDSVPQEKVLTLFLMNNYSRIVVYENAEENSLIYTTKQGLVLANLDKERQFINLGTYIDDSMLNVTQRLAKEQITDKLPDEIDDDSHFYYNAVVSELKPIVKDIYEKYKGSAGDYLVFRKTNGEQDVKLDFKLKAGKETLERNRIKELPKSQPVSSLAGSLIKPNEIQNRQMILSAISQGYKFEMSGNENGKGKLIFRENARVVMEYVGGLKEGKPHGKGVMRLSDGSSFEGEWEEGKMEGHFIHRTPDGGYEDGEFLNMLKNGHVHRHGEGFDAWGFFKHGKLVGPIKIVCEDFTYEGEYTYGMNGRGKITFPDKVTFEGVLKKGMLNGRGKEYRPDGSVIEAKFKNSMAVGKGKMTMPDGIIYEGEFDEGDLDGAVKKTYPDGTWETVDFIWGEEYDPEEDEDLDDEEFNEWLNSLPKDETK